MPVKVKQQQPPSCPVDIAEKILHYGMFKEALDFFIHYLETPMSSSIVLRGNPGTGKRTLLEEAFSVCEVLPIYLNPYHYHDDLFALKRVALELGIQQNKSSMQDICDEIKRQTKASKRKVVLILQDFQEFCRQKQSLLYTLLTLTQHGKNVCLIGVTHSLDCAHGLEKRVRSRLNAQSYNLDYPYRSLREYLEFASQLVDGHKFQGKLLDQFTHMWQTGNYEIQIVKHFLISICSWDENKKLTVNQPDMPIHNPKNDFNFVAERMLALTRTQLDILKLAVHYGSKKSTVEFTFEDLYDHASKIHFTSFTRNFSMSMRDLEPLEKTFIKRDKPNDSLTPKTLFILNITSDLFRYVVENNADLHSIKTDQLWKTLPAMLKLDASRMKGNSEIHL